ncbi:hypothetical protein [Nocardia alni]|uniref:hypothetical protein n=1 Tax=Nocardia alni TaxID=2815723 RepID=UPI001C21B783|nr:hypothetical protein [Nocardia alni]
MARDRTARARIREYLATTGPLEETSGHATSELMEAIEYEGSPIAFIQLITSMDRDGEIERTIRGKRTYRISASDKVVAAVAGKRSKAAKRVAVQGNQVVEIDYQRLARALVQELLGAVAPGAAVTPDREPGDSPGERDRILAEHNEYARRLRIARERLDELLGTGEGLVELPEGTILTIGS